LQRLGHIRTFRRRNGKLVSLALSKIVGRSQLLATGD
jgi:hypothetical protein